MKKTKLYLLKLTNRTSSPSSCISGTACLISCESSLFVITAENREGFARNLREVGVVHSEDLEVDQWIVPIFPQREYSERNASAHENHPTREKARRVSPFLAWGDFHARSRFARSTIREEKWGLLVVYIAFGPYSWLHVLNQPKPEKVNE